MCPISNSNRSTSQSEASRKDRDITTAFTGYELLQNNSLKKANNIPIDRVFKLYGIYVNKYNRKIICPFKSHKGGHENSASFLWYPETNTYCCFGCHQGSSAVDFVSLMDHISPKRAAEKILDLLGNLEEMGDDYFIDKIDFSEQLKIMISFSDDIRNFRKKYFDKESSQFIENICQSYDDISLKYQLDNEALGALIEKYQRKINFYKQCFTQ